MRNAKEMYDFCMQNKIGSKLEKEEHFQLIVNCLTPDEDVEFCFMGLHNVKSLTQSQDIHAYALTNHRFIMAQKKKMFRVGDGNGVESCAWSQIIDVGYKIKMLMTNVYVNTAVGQYTISLNKQPGLFVHQKFSEILYRQKNAPALTSVQANNSSSLDEIKKLKELLDANIITQEEFEAKKRQLLNI
jgi:hypothetical protein